MLISSHEISKHIVVELHLNIKKLRLLFAPKLHVAIITHCFVYVVYINT